VVVSDDLIHGMVFTAEIFLVLTEFILFSSTMNVVLLGSISAMAQESG